MSKLTIITDRALELAQDAGDNLRHFAPSKEWLQAGVALGAVKHGGKAAGKFVRQHPTASIATATALVAGAGLLGYLVYRKQKQLNAEHTGESRSLPSGRAKHIHARRIGLKREG